MKLQIADNLSLPLEFVTERISFLARTGAGKSGGMRVLNEEMLHAKQFTIFLDPKGDAWGIRSKFPVLIMGGDHGDIQLEANAGTFIADFLVRERISTVLDVSHFSEADMVRFMGDFADRFYRTNKEVVHLFIDEADEFAPQSNYTPAQTKCLAGIQRLQRRGRGRGIGLTLATQRSAVINKSVLTQTGTLIVMQTTAPHDLKAVDDWLKYSGSAQAREIIMASLTTMKPREAWVYSPQLLKEPKRITFRAFESYDSMRTPAPGESRRAPKKLADIDLSAVKQHMASTLEEIKANDPTELKKQVKKLTDTLFNIQNAAKKDDLKLVENNYQRKLNEQREFFQKVLLNLTRLFEQTVGLVDGALEQVQKSQEFKVKRAAPLSTKDVTDAFKDGVKGLLPGDITKVVPLLVKRGPIESGDISTAQFRILRSLYWLSKEEITPVKVAFYAGYTVNGHFTNTLGSLRSEGYVENKWELSDKAVNALGNIEQKPTGTELSNWIKPKLTSAECKILDVLLDAAGDRVAVELLAERAGYTVNGHFTNSLGHLRTLQIAEGGSRDGGVRANPVFFE